jgi:hypothetical protein
MIGDWLIDGFLSCGAGLVELAAMALPHSGHRDFPAGPGFIERGHFVPARLTSAIAPQDEQTRTTSGILRVYVSRNL